MYILENYIAKRCQDCSTPGGITFKLIYHSSENNKGIFSKLFMVPPKLEFGLPTQFSCPVDSFIFLNDSLDIEAMSYKSNCLDLNLGLFPFQDLENVVHIFEECNINYVYIYYCNGINFTNTTNLIIKNYFPELISQVDMGYFMKLMPAASTNDPVLAATFSKENHEVTAELFSVQISLFDTVVNTMSSINGDNLSANFEIELYSKYLSEIALTMKQTSWNGASILIQGRFLDVTNNIPSLLENYITEYLHTLYIRSVVRVNNAEIVYNKCLSQQASATENHYKITNSKSLTDALFQTASESLNDQENVVNNVSDELAEANEEVKKFQGMMNNVCQIQKCEEICVPHEECNPCVRAVNTAIQEICKISRSIPMLITVVRYWTFLKFEFRWKKVCGSKSICVKWKICIKLSICTRLPAICVVKYKRAVFLPKIVHKDIILYIPCAAVVVQAPLKAQCCAQVGCKKQMEDYTCANNNKQCHATRGKIYEKLSNEQTATATLLQRSDKENEKEASLKLKLAQLTVRKNNMDKRFAESQKSLSDANMAVQLASSTYNKIRNATNLDQLEKLRIAKKNDTSLQFDTVNITAVSFNTTIVSESPTVFTLSVTGNI